MADLPTGTVTFLFTDIESSTLLWERSPEEMRAACVRHDELVEGCVERNGGVLVRPRGEGDSRFAVFDMATDALMAACALRRDLCLEPWPPQVPLRVRMALHTGEADLREGDYYGSAVNRCARLRDAAHGGQALLSQATYALVCDSVPEGVELRDLGDHRLKDLNRPERIYQIAFSDLPSEFPPLRTLDLLPHNLPQQITSFVGREKEAEEVRSILSKARLLTLTGSGGVGKTRLSLQVAADLVDQYPDGVWLVELAGLDESEALPDAVGCALGLANPVSGKEPTESRVRLQNLVDALRPKSLLLLLDNCEHLVAACAHLAEALLKACPRLRILATSRQRLGVVGEVSYRIPSLSLPDPENLPPLEALGQFDGIRLFVDRVSASDHSFRLTQRNAQAVARICRRLDGIPLAIELAAARAGVVPVEQVAARLEDRFQLLTGGSPGALPRQQTLRALIDWSYDLLPPEERALLRRLSVFAGGCTLEAAERVCSGEGLPESRVMDVLARLVEKSLVVCDSTEGMDARYHLLDTVRQYGAERLAEAGEDEAVRRHHRDYYLTLALGTAARLFGPEELEWCERLRRENDNLRAALGWCLSGRKGMEAALQLAANLSRSWLVGDRAPVRTFLSKGLEAARGLGGKVRGSTALQALGSVATRLGDRASSFGHPRRPRPLELAEGPDGGAALFRAGVESRQRGDVDGAAARFGECLVIFLASGNRLGAALALDGLADLAVHRGELVRAASLLGAAQAQLEPAGLRCQDALTDYTPRVSLLRDRLGPAVFTSAWEKGRAMAPEQLMRSALTDTG